MGECLISRRGGGSGIFALPVLNAEYPQDVEIIKSSSETASFSVLISEHGKPATYTYQWYLNGTKISGAINSMCTIDLSMDVGTHHVYCEVTNKAGTVSSRIATLRMHASIPTYTYNGESVLTEESDSVWNIQFLSSGTLTLDTDRIIDVFVVGGGGSGAAGNGASGGGGGYTYTQKNVAVTGGQPYSIVVGAGGRGITVSNGIAGGTSSAFGVSAEGGAGGILVDSGGASSPGGAGGSGGGAGTYAKRSDGGFAGAGGSNGSDGGHGESELGGAGQGATTRAFSESTGALYAGGGGGAARDWQTVSAGGEGGGGAGGSRYDSEFINPTSGKTNTGGGGGGATWTDVSGSGGSGIVIIRNAR